MKSATRLTLLTSLLVGVCSLVFSGSTRQTTTTATRRCLPQAWVVRIRWCRPTIDGGRT